MANGKQIRDRIFALSGALLFFVSAIALTVAVIVQQVQSKNTDKSTQNTSQNSTADNAQSCQDSQTETANTAPEVYKPTGKVTALQSTDLTVGTGDEAKSGDCVVVQYYGTLASDGTVFDENYDKTTGFAFQLGAGQVIPGWDQGVAGMKVGGIRRLLIPAELAYGDQSPSDAVPANADLVFVVKLLRIQK